MKTLRNFLVAAIVSITFMSATYTGPTTANLDSELRARIAKLVDHPQFLLEEQAVVNVMFQLNDRGEIVVLDVDTDNSTIDQYVKNRLNYQNAKLDTYDSGLAYYIDLRFEKK